jgi:transposase
LKEDDFIKHGLLGLFPEVKALPYSSDLERLIFMVSKAPPSLSQQAMLGIAEAVPLTQEGVDIEVVSQIVASYGRSASAQPSDLKFWSRIQRSLNQLRWLRRSPIQGRDKKQRKKTFFRDDDFCHKRLELLRELFFNRSTAIKETCLQFGVSPTSYYRLVKEYRLFGPWAVIPANCQGKETMSSWTELNIILEKLRHPRCSAPEIVKILKLRCSKYAVYRVFSRWGLTNKNLPPIALDRYCSIETSTNIHY